MLFFFRFVHRAVMGTTRGMPSTDTGKEKQGGTTATLLPESRLASGCPSSLARTGRSRSPSRSASLCLSRVAPKCQGSLASLCQRRAADRCQCRNPPRLPSRFALEVEHLTDLEAMEDTGAEKQFVALTAFKISLLNTFTQRNISLVCSNSRLLTSLLLVT